MKTKIFFILLNILLFKVDSSFSQTFEWAKRIGDVNSEKAEAIVTDIVGNVYTTGDFAGVVDFDPGVGIYDLTSSGTGTVNSVFISKLAADGSFVWAKEMGGDSNGNGSAGATSIAIDLSGNIYITGGFGGTVDFDPGIGVFNLTSTGSIFGGDAFVVKLNAFGTFIWAKQMGGPSGAGRSMALDAIGNIYIAGDFEGSADFDPSANTYNLSSTGIDGDIFVCKLDPSGAFIWAKSWSKNGFESALALDNGGNVYVTGSFNGTIDFNPAIGGSNVYNLSSAGQTDIFINKLNTFGDFVWAKRIGGTENDQSFSIKTDNNGNIYTTGYFHGTVDFDPNGGLTNLSSAGMIGSDVFICKIDSFGNFVWAKNMGGTNAEVGYSITVDDVQNVYTLGFFKTTADFDPDTAVFSITSLGSRDVFISKLDDLGNFVWAKSFGGVSDDEGFAITLDADNNIYTTGVFRTTVDFDPDSSVYNMTATGSSADIFIHKIRQVPVAITKIESPLTISLYPNPTSGLVQLEIAQDFRNANIEIINTLGQVLARTQTSDRNSQLVLPNETGIYFIRVEVEGKVGIYRVLKN